MKEDPKQTYMQGFEMFTSGIRGSSSTLALPRGRFFFPNHALNKAFDAPQNQSSECQKKMQRRRNLESKEVETSKESAESRRCELRVFEKVKSQPDVEDSSYKRGEIMRDYYR